MSHGQRHIKVGDLLRASGKTDTVIFEEKSLLGLPNVLQPGVSGSIHLTSLNKTTVEVVLENMSCKVEYISDVSGESFVQDIFIEEYEALFVLPDEDGKEDVLDIYESYNDIYNIEEKDFSIDVEPIIINAIQSQEPLIKIKDDEKMLDGGENDEYFLDERL